MDKSLDTKAMKLAMAGQMKDQIIGVFGDRDSDECVAKLHSVVQLAETLKIDDIKIEVTLEELIKAQELFIKNNTEEVEEA